MASSILPGLAWLDRAWLLFRSFSLASRFTARSTQLDGLGCLSGFEVQSVSRAGRDRIGPGHVKSM